MQPEIPEIDQHEYLSLVMKSHVAMVLVLIMILAGVAFLVVTFSARFVQLGLSPEFALILCPPIAQLLGSWLLMYEMNCHAKPSEIGSKQFLHSWFLGLTGGAAAAQFVLDGMLRRQVFSEYAHEIKLLKAIYFWGGLVMITFVLAFLKYGGKRTKNKN